MSRRSAPVNVDARSAPALKRLLHDVQAGHVDCVVVYKVDRLSRSLVDFARRMGSAAISKRAAATW